MQHPCRTCEGFGDVPFPCGISFGFGDHDLRTNLACFMRLEFAAGDASAPRRNVCNENAWAGQRLSNETQVMGRTADNDWQEFYSNCCPFGMARSIMSRIDALLATQVADTTRPVQTREDQHLQVATARQKAISGDEGALSAGDKAPSADELHSAIAHIKQVIEVASGRQLAFSVDDTGKTLLVKIVGDQGEVIRQIPSQEVLDLRKRIDALVGAFINQRA